jgi:hypothetical protein
MCSGVQQQPWCWAFINPFCLSNNSTRQRHDTSLHIIMSHPSATSAALQSPVLPSIPPKSLVVFTSRSRADFIVTRAVIDGCSWPTLVLAKWSRNTEGWQQQDATLYSIHNHYLIQNNSTISSPNFVSISKVTSSRSFFLFFYGWLLIVVLAYWCQNTQQSAKDEEGFVDPLAHCSLSILLVYLVLKLFQPQTLPATQQLLTSIGSLCCLLSMYSLQCTTLKPVKCT